MKGGTMRCDQTTQKGTRCNLPATRKVTFWGSQRPKRMNLCALHYTFYKDNQYVQSSHPINR